VLRKAAKCVGVGIAIALALSFAAVVATAHWGDRSLWPPTPGAPVIEIFVVSHGYHSGIVIPRAVVAEEATQRSLGALTYVTTRFAAFDWLEIGWGDETFYRQVPTVASLTVAIAVRALLRPGNPSVLHVVGVKGHPRSTFIHSDLVELELGEAGFARLVDQLDATFAPEQGGLLADELGPGLYGPSLFFRANGAFHLFNVCNHWVARLLDAAGVPTAPVLATLPQGLLIDLEWRSGRVRLPQPP